MLEEVFHRIGKLAACMWSIPSYEIAKVLR